MSEVSRERLESAFDGDGDDMILLLLLAFCWADCWVRSQSHKLAGKI